MTKKLISTGSSYEKKIGYSRAVIKGDFIFVSGTTGFDYDTMTISSDLVSQTIQCFENIQKVMNTAGTSLDDIVRITYILPDASDFEKCWPTMNKYLGDIRPAATMISAGLADKRMKIEIEVTAMK